jgi:hypothetical protein
VRYRSSLKIEPLLLEEARADLAWLGGVDALFTPYLQLAEAREFDPADPQVQPLNFVPSEKALQTLVEVPSDALVGVIAVAARSRHRLEAIGQLPGGLLQGRAGLLRIGWRIEGGLAAARGPVPA